eukprot:scaffold50358_cov42-Attheya_sp.AAC.2
MSFESSRSSVMTEPRYLNESVNSTCPAATAIGPVSVEFGLFGFAAKYMHSDLDFLGPLVESSVVETMYWDWDWDWVLSLLF